MKVQGDHQPLVRVPTGCWSFDKSLSGGMPLRAIYELYGSPLVGKTTFATFLAGKVRADGRVLIAETEFKLNLEYVKRNLTLAGFGGTIQLIPNKWKKGITHEAILNELSAGLIESDVSAGVLDSVGALISKAQVEGDVGEAFVGKEARMVWHTLRKSVYALQRGREPSFQPCNLFLVNHVHGIIGGRGIVTSGGKGPDYLSSVRINMWRDEVIKGDGSIVVNGRIDKYSYGPHRRTFQLFLLTEWGIHPGLTAMADCCKLKLCKREPRGVMMGKTNLGRLGTLLKAARRGDTKRFEPFYVMLAEYDNKKQVKGVNEDG
jgi:recombination protein RecA